jgi:hypothetical protein
MSAKAEAEAAAALRELGATLKASTNAPKLHTLKFFNELGLDEEEDELELSMMEELARAPSFASIIIMWADRSRCVEQLLPLALHPRPVCCGAGA